MFCWCYPIIGKLEYLSACVIQEKFLPAQKVFSDVISAITGLDFKQSICETIGICTYFALKILRPEVISSLPQPASNPCVLTKLLRLGSPSSHKHIGLMDLVNVTGSSKN